MRRLCYENKILTYLYFLMCKLEKRVPVSQCNGFYIISDMATHYIVGFRVIKKDSVYNMLKKIIVLNVFVYYWIFTNVESVTFR